jgi:hypothetical protein
MNKVRVGLGLGNLILNISVALYLFANGVLGITTKSSKVFERKDEFGRMLQTIFGKGDLTDVIIIALSVCAIAAGVFLLLALFKVEIKITDLILFIFVIVWVAFIVIADIIAPMQSKSKLDFLPYLVQLSAHLMVLGGLISSTKRLG